MKRLTALLLSLILALLLFGCAEQSPAMYIQPAQLTQTEQNLADLIGTNLDDHIFDFKVDGTVQKISINAYELVDGQWERFYGGGGRPFTDPKGRLMVDFEDLEKGLRDAIQSENHNGSTKIETHTEFDTTGMHRATSMLNQKTEIYEQEIPLAVQILTTKNEIRSFDVTYFHYPEEYEKYNHDHIYAVTVLFSQEPLS